MNAIATDVELYIDDDAAYDSLRAICKSNDVAMSSSSTNRSGWMLFDFRGTYENVLKVMTQLGFDEDDAMTFMSTDSTQQ